MAARSIAVFLAAFLALAAADSCLSDGCGDYCTGSSEYSTCCYYCNGCVSRCSSYNSASFRWTTFSNSCSCVTSLSAGAVAGIVIACVFAAFFFLVVFCWWRRRRNAYTYAVVQQSVQVTPAYSQPAPPPAYPGPQYGAAPGPYPGYQAPGYYPPAPYQAAPYQAAPAYQPK